MKKNLDTQLHNYATGTAQGCQHPIKDVDSNNFCRACNTQLEIKVVVDKDTTIAAQQQQIEALRRALEKVLKYCQDAGLKNVSTNDPVQLAVYLSLQEANQALLAVTPQEEQ